MDASRQARLRRPGWVLFALAIASFGLLAWALAAPAVSEAAGPTRMALSARGDGVACDSAEPDECLVPLGGTFTLAVEFLGPPAEGYIAVSTQLAFGGLTYIPFAPEDENVWPDNQLPVRAPERPNQIVAHGGLTGLTQPFPVSHHEGSIVEVSLMCSPERDTFTVHLISLGGASSALGASYVLPSEQTIPAKSDGEIEIDLNEDGTIESVPVADALEISCQEVPPTPTAGGPGEASPTPGGPGGTGTSIAPTSLPPTGAGDGNALDGDGDGVGLWIIITAISAAAAAALAVLTWRIVQARRAG